jgi:hypothetical protein
MVFLESRLAASVLNPAIPLPALFTTFLPVRFGEEKPSAGATLSCPLFAGSEGRPEKIYFRLPLCLPCS